MKTNIDVKEEIIEGIHKKAVEQTIELLRLNQKLSQEVEKRKQIEEQLHAKNVLLKLFSRVSSQKEYINAVSRLIKGWSKCRCVGVRLLDEQGRIPYQSYICFSKEFFESENWLSIKEDKCACTRVISGKLEPQDASVITENGSFCANDAMDFFAKLSEKEKERFRGICAQCGFGSVAVIPIRYKNSITGAIHLADEKRGMVGPIVIGLIESLTALIGEGIYKFNLEDKSRQEHLTLDKAQKELQEAKRLSDIGALAAIVAHELRSPLGAVRIAAYNIRRKAQNPILESHLANIERKILESDQIINNLLFYSRLKMPNYEFVDIHSVLNDCVDSIKKRFSSQKIRFRNKIRLLKNILIEADSLQMNELFGNILSNACDAVSRCEGEVEIGAGKESDDAIKISFKDNGVGIDRENLERIFEPFFTTKAKGTGLGLSVCQQIVNLHGGKIEAQSAKETGTVFTVTLPIRRKQEDAKKSC